MFIIPRSNLPVLAGESVNALKGINMREGSSIGSSSESVIFSKEFPPPVASLRGKSFLSTEHLSFEEWQGLFDLAKAAKLRGPGFLGEPLRGKTLALVFFNPSLRTRVSMSMAVQQLGGSVIPLEIGKGTWDLEHLPGVIMDGSRSEHVKEAIPVLSQYVDGIAVRCFPQQNDFDTDARDEILHSFAQHASVPVFNMESAFWHPMQALADMLTVSEVKGGFKKRKIVLSWANHPKILPHSVPNSFALATAQCGADLWIVAPEGYGLDESIIHRCERFAHSMGSTLQVTSDRKKAYEGADIIYAKSWASRRHYGFAEREDRTHLRDWMITDQVMEMTNNGKFMHCLPVRRNVVVSDHVLDGGSSVVVQQAANRLHMQRALLASVWSGL